MSIAVWQIKKRICDHKDSSRHILNMHLLLNLISSKLTSCLINDISVQSESKLQKAQSNNKEYNLLSFLFSNYSHMQQFLWSFTLTFHTHWKEAVTQANSTTQAETSKFQASSRLFFKAHWAGLVGQISSQSELQSEGHSLSKVGFLGINYSATIWSIGLLFHWKLMHISFSYCAKLYISLSFQLRGICNVALINLAFQWLILMFLKSKIEVTSKKHQFVYKALMLVSQKLLCFSVFQ